MNSRGLTLIELMVAVALIGIGAVAFHAATQPQLARAGQAALHERAMQVLEYEAESALAGKPADEAVLAELLQELPSPNLDETSRDGVRTFTITWQPPGTSARRLSLAVLGRAP